MTALTKNGEERARRSAGDDGTLALSVVVPARDEAPSLGPLIEGIAAACAAWRFEVIVVDDGSDDDTQAVLARAGRAAPWLRALRHENPGGQSAAVHSGVLAARAPLVCTLDGDGQNPPEDIPRLVATWEGDGRAGLGLVAGQRVGRRDRWSKRAASRIANTVRARVLRDGTRDTGCGLKLFRRDAFLALPYFEHMHRYLPALFAAGGWAIAHVDVGHAPRRAGRSNYTNLGRALAGLHDLVGVAWLIRRRKRVRAVETTRITPTAGAAPTAETAPIAETASVAGRAPPPPSGPGAPLPASRAETAAP